MPQKSLETFEEKQLALQQLDQARSRFDVCKLKEEIAKKSLYDSLVELDRVSAIYDNKVQDSTSALTELGRWRVLLHESGFCEFSSTTHTLKYINTS